MVTGKYTPAPGLGATRNMFVVRQGRELVIVSTARLTPEGEARLDALGEVKNVVRIGGFHGADDAYYLQRYKPTFWAPPNLPDAAAKDRDLSPGSCPIDGCQVFLFEHGKVPEACLVLEREGGILLSADSYQNWTTFEDCTWLGSLMLRAFGMGPTIIGGPWAKRQGPAIRADFERLLSVPFKHLLPGHGSALRDTAKEGLLLAVAHRFG